jgi:CheY-like chemotaxis protein
MLKAVILCVDDESVILNSLKIQLKNAFETAYSYESAESADEAIEVLQELQLDEIPVVVIVSDWLMPGIQGDEFLIRVHEIYPKIVKIMLTGQADDRAVDRAIQYANLHRCLRKPWQARELVEAIKSGLAQL